MMGEVVRVEETKLLIQPSMREHIVEIEKELLKLPQVQIPVRHIFSNGLYAREITVPEGLVITGVIHKLPQINILSKGIIRVNVGDDIQELHAPYTVASEAGIKRIAYTVTEVIWTTIIHTFLTDVEEIERQYFAHSVEEFDAFIKQIEHE